MSAPTNHHPASETTANGIHQRALKQHSVKTALAVCATLTLATISLVGCTKPQSVSQSEFSQLKVGMSYAQVATLIGEKPTEDTFTPPAKHIVRWKNPDQSQLLCIFINDKLNEKSWIKAPTS